VGSDDFAAGESNVGEKALVALNQRAMEERGFEAHGDRYSGTSLGIPIGTDENFTLRAKSQAIFSAVC